MGHVIDRCIIAIYKPVSVIAYLADAILESMYQFNIDKLTIITGPAHSVSLSRNSRRD